MPLHMNSGTDTGAFGEINDVSPVLFETSPVLTMVNQTKPISTDLIQMIRVKMSANLSRTKVTEFSLETPLEDLWLDSLDRLTLLFEIEDHFNVVISTPRPPR